MAVVGAAGCVTATHASAADLLATGATGDTLIRFDSANPAVIASTTDVIGIGGGFLYDIDFAPTGELYGDVFDDDDGAARVYQIDPATGVGSRVTPDPVTLDPSFAGFDFDPVGRELRYVNEADENFRINPADGAVTAATTLSYGAGDPQAGDDPEIAGAAFSDNTSSANTTTLYGVDVASDSLVTQALNSGVLSTRGALGADTDSEVGFDIGPDGAAYASLTDPGAVTSSLYSIDLATGAATLIGPIGAAPAEQPIEGLSVVNEVPAIPNPTRVSVSDVFVREGNKRKTKAVFEVRRELRGGPPTASVAFSTNDGSARAGADYVAKAGRVSFAADENRAVISVQVKGDLAREPDETFTLRLQEPSTEVELERARAEATIDNDDGGTGPFAKCTLRGTKRSDKIVGTRARDVICGRRGDDRIRGLEGRDVVRGGAGDDVIDGGSDGDHLRGGAGDDRIKGGAGRDVILGGSGDDTADADPDRDAVDLGPHD